jgi:hypothetical protein
MKTLPLSDVTPQLLKFIDICQSVNYNNNNSLKSMKFHWCLENGGAWYATYNDNDDIISLSGIHPFKDGYRALFRGVQLYPRNIGINKYHMQSHCFYYQLPYQIEFSGDKPLYITTNVINDASGKMTRIDKTFCLLERTQLVSNISQEVIFNTLQNVWVLNKEAYFKIRNKE